MGLAEQLIVVADTYAASRTLSRARVSTLVFNQGGKIDAIAGGADLSTGRWERAMQWFSDNWPEGADWPADIARPLPTAAAETAVGADADRRAAAGAD